jgi:hypothetical protein
MSILANILTKEKSRIITLISTVGTFLGLVIILLTIQFHFDFQDITTNKTDALEPDFLIITKQINELHSAGILSTTFSEKEINEIQKQTFFEEVAPFHKNLYHAVIESKNDDFPLNFQSLVSFESVPNQFIDVKTNAWNWNLNSPYIPIIAPRSYLNMYNFGMADAQGLPVISEGLISNFTVSLKARGNGNTESFDTKIIAFSDRIESVLVPKEFIVYSNNKFGNKKHSAPSKLIVNSNDIQNPNLSSFLDKKGYQTNQEKLKGNKSSTVLKLAFSFLLFIGLIVVILSVLSFIQAAQIKINRASQDIKKLNSIGYYYKSLSSIFVKKMLLNFIIISTIAYVTVFSIKLFIIAPLVKENLGIEFSQFLNFPTTLFWIILTSVTCVFILINIRGSFLKNSI